MKEFLKKFFSFFVPNFVKEYIRRDVHKYYENFIEYSSLSYSQEGEDLILNNFFKNKENGYYIDIGAHHPKRFSNTYFFYKKNWTGINIDAMPGSMELFKKERPKDINIETPISDKEEELTFYFFEEPANNGFWNDKEIKQIDSELKGKKNIKCRTLESVLDEFFPSNKVIDFISIDVELYEINVLKSNNWNKYNPK